MRQHSAIYEETMYRKPAFGLSIAVFLAILSSVIGPHNGGYLYQGAIEPPMLQRSVTIASTVTPTLTPRAYLPLIQRNHIPGLQVVDFLARVYIYDPQKTWDYWNLVPFYTHRFEAHHDDQHAALEQNILAPYDVIVLSVSDAQLTTSDRTILQNFTASGGVVISRETNAYEQLDSLQSRYESGELRAKGPVTLVKVETANLRIYYPSFIPLLQAAEQARILQFAYNSYRDVIGGELPFGGETIYVVFNPFWDFSAAGPCIRMGQDSGIYEGRVVPPDGAFYHELVHDFTSGTSTNAAAFVDINGAFTEALANLLMYWYGHEILRYSPEDIAHYDNIAIYWRSLLYIYEQNHLDPYSLNWEAHNSAQPYLEAMLFYISETYGWQIWRDFFAKAKASGCPGIPASRRGTLTNLRSPEGQEAMNFFVFILGQAAGRDLTPLFTSWGFEIDSPHCP